MFIPRCRLFALGLLWLLTASGAAQDAGSKAKPAADRWEPAMAAFEAADKAAPPPQGAVVFIGSSSIRLWDLTKSFPEVACVNRGFGGSQMADAARYVGRIVLPLQPRMIVLYEGDNDLNAGLSPQQVANAFDLFLQAVRAELPATPIVVIGLKPSPARWKLIEQQRQTNRLLAQRCALDGHARVLDVEQPMLGTDGEPQGDIFRADKLHMNDQGYAIWNELLRPLLVTR
jgi:lysophospholipase L1-like esterase